MIPHAPKFLANPTEWNNNVVNITDLDNGVVIRTERLPKDFKLTDYIDCVHTDPYRFTISTYLNGHINCGSWATTRDEAREIHEKFANMPFAKIVDEDGNETELR